MSYENYISDIKEKLEKKGYSVSDKDIIKRNDIIKPAISISRGENRFACIYYDEQLISMYGQLSPEEVMKNIERDLDVPDIMPDMKPDVKSLIESDAVSFMILEKERNKKYLADKVWRDAGLGFVVLPYLMGPDETTAVYTKEMLKGTGISDEYAIKTAIEKAKDNTPASINTMFSPVVAISNNTGVFGAAAFFYENVATDVRNMLGDYYVIPSSVHEIIAFGGDGRDPQEIKNMIHMANSNAGIVSPEDILSDRLFRLSNDGFEEVE